MGVSSLFTPPPSKVRWGGVQFVHSPYNFWCCVLIELLVHWHCVNTEWNWGDSESNYSQLSRSRKQLLSSITVPNKLAAISEIVGPEGTPYEGGIFKLEIQIPDRYLATVCQDGRDPDLVSWLGNTPPPPREINPYYFWTPFCCLALRSSLKL